MKNDELKPAAAIDSSSLVGINPCPECNGTGKVGDNGPGGILLNGKWTGNTEWDRCGCERDN